MGQPAMRVRHELQRSCMWVRPFECRGVSGCRVVAGVEVLAMKQSARVEVMVAVMAVEGVYAGEKEANRWTGGG